MATTRNISSEMMIQFQQEIDFNIFSLKTILTNNKLSKSQIHELCQYAFRNRNALPIQYVPEDLLTSEIILLATQQNWMSIFYIPNEKLWTIEIAIIATSQDIQTIKELPDFLRNKETYKKLVQSNGLALEYIIEEDCCDNEVIIEAVKQNGLAIEFLRGSIDNEVIDIAIQQNGLALRSVREKTFDRCLMAVQENGSAIQYVPDEWKDKIIQTVSVEKILSDDYVNLHYFPSDINYERQIANFLSKVEHVIITPDHQFLDHEMRDIYLVYANVQKRQGKALHVDRSYLHKLIKDLNTHAKQPINLCLLSHSNAESTDIGGMEIATIIETLQSIEAITKVTLLSCNTAKSTVLDEETRIISNFNTFEEQMINQYGLIAVSRDVEESIYFDFFKKCNLNACCLLIKGASTQLVYLEKDPNTNTIIKTIKYDLDDKKVKRLEALLTKKKSIFPISNTQTNILRNDKNPLDHATLQRTMSICIDTPQFLKNHPNFKNDKSIYPFLAHATISENEANAKLKTSLMKKVVKAIRNGIDSNKIRRNIVVKGYTKALHVNTQSGSQGMVVATSHLYHKYATSTFFSKKENLDYKRLHDEQKNDIAKMRANIKSENTGLKSISVEMKAN